MPFGISFMGTAYSEPSLIGFAYAYEQHTRTRLQRRAYPEATPKIQLIDVIQPAGTIQYIEKKWLALSPLVQWRSYIRSLR